ncbi:hypothetical protein ACWEQ8_41690 [Streptomyces noursei]|uniref:hypothetical protein n=1 Tax=Streptomyces noursei TaxID=1971 RepID=UPI0005C8460A|nr:hypothetical protein [Streptomyces noursei]
MDDRYAQKALPLFADEIEVSSIRVTHGASSMEIAWGVTHLGSVLALVAVPMMLVAHAWETPSGAFALTSLTALTMRSCIAFLHARRR